MPELSNALFEPMRRVDGFKFNGHLTSASSINTKEKAPYRVLIARRPTFLVAGDTIFTKGGEVIILMDHPDDYPWAVSYKAVYALDQLPWSRQSKIFDTVAKVQKDVGYQTLGILYVNYDTPEAYNFMGLQDTKYRFITGQDIKVDDKVGDYIIKRIVKSLGVKIAFAS